MRVFSAKFSGTTSSLTRDPTRIAFGAFSVWIGRSMAHAALRLLKRFSVVLLLLFFGPVFRVVGIANAVFFAVDAQIAHNVSET